MVSATVTSGWQDAAYAYRGKTRAAEPAVLCTGTESAADTRESVIGTASFGMSCGLTARYAPESTELYESFIRKLEKQQEEGTVPAAETRAGAENGTGGAEAGKQTGEDEEEASYLQMIQEYMDELFTKIEDGDTEPKFQLGGRAYTVKEWNELLEQFDSAQDAIRQIIKEQIEERIERAKQAKARAEDARIDMITSDSYQARFPLQEVDEQGNPKEDIYLTAIDRDGIRCSRPGDSTYLWEITFTDEEQYERAVEFMEWAKERMDNYRFTSNERFWQDFLGEEMDVEGFKEFLEGTDNGVPDYLIRVGDSDFIDRAKAQWAKYMNPPGFKFYTAQEFADLVAAEIEKNQANLTKLTNPYGETYRKYHPEYRGEAIFCEYPGGPLYTADEIGERMYERAMREKKTVKETNMSKGRAASTGSDDDGLQVWFDDEPLGEWAASDPKYTDPETGISWYVRDGRHPYMTEEDAARLKELCRETGEPWLKRFAEMTGMIQYLDDSTTAFVGTNGTVIKSKDGKELLLDTSSLSYDMIMDMFRDLPESSQYFDSAYWQEKIQRVKPSVTFRSR